MKDKASTRIIVIDDNIAIHEDVRKTLCPTTVEHDTHLEALKAELFGATQPPDRPDEPSIRLSFATQGQQGYAVVQQAYDAGDPFSVAVVDMRMPPGWDGLDTIEHLWRVDPKLQVVICTAFSDHSWVEIAERLIHSEGLLVLKKPFEPVELQQMVSTLSAKWASERKIARHVARLDELVAQRTSELRGAYQSLQSEVAERERMELELRHAQKMEAVGQLAAGIAHEINTPVQFVTDSVFFLRETFESYETALQKCRTALRQIDNLPPSRDEWALIEREHDLGFLREEWPRAIDRTLHGLERMGSVVSAMRSFAHPGSRHAMPSDLNAALHDTLAVAHSAYKFIAKVETDFGHLPPVVCHVSDLNQVFLNLIVNAAHAIQEKAVPGQLGTIKLSTRHRGEVVQISVEDDGIGIPEDVQPRVFDPFFTTKAVGEGTGQGLAIVHSLIVGRHGGKVHLDSAPGVGTKFDITLPVAGPAN